MVVALALVLAGCAVDPEPDPRDLEQSKSAIYGGWVANSGDFPQVVYVLADGAACTGTLIAPTTVLTAAHCLDHYPAASNVWVGFGAPWPSEFFNAVSYEIHPDFDMDYLFGVVVSSHHDTALIHLASAAPYPVSKLVSPAEESAYVTEGSLAWIAGFGENNLSGYPSSGIKILGTGYISNFKEWVIRLDDLPSSACGGDSGGPFYSHVPGVGLKQAGVLSFGAPSCETWNKYARVTLDLWWIHLNARVPCDSGLPCDQRCGDYECDLDHENIYTCLADCAYTACGDEVCTLVASETTSNCPSDCYCGDEICDWDEKMGGTCTSDCTPRIDGSCPSGVCDGNENWAECPQDCQ
ncbi:S1 family peptidase [Hyalangium sp.]|uniref:S1 family peptidase n=1 Tax=Hyalangium sp. TaxID=2028555 RepID=UPI0039C89163